ncbi:CinA family nicotinamide mononucleotide deamidase-related protein [Haliea sp. E17]|uniref:CinA family nicotinamide mononucleotide deamidase-related protein n=1 Tax=Haliea sp. E17 TaxID=3401576 RepID=UPI003AAD2416
MSETSPRVQLLLTGNELMSGDTIDSNSAMIARRLDELAIDVRRKVTVGDDPELLREELAGMAASADVVIVNGGLGPTVDDLTAEVLARVAGVPLEENAQALAHLEHWCGGRKLTLNAANRKQAILPQGCRIIDNPIGSAVGFELTVGRCRIICTPGVPGELRAMLDSILAGLAAQMGRVLERDILRLQTFGLGESSAQQLIADNIGDWPPEVHLGFRAGAPQLEIKLGVDRTRDLPLRERCLAQLRELFGDHIIGEGDASLAGTVIDLLRQRGATLTTAESCTGGLIASMLTRIAGSSDVFHAGFVTYANDIKRDILDVPQIDLDTHGAVSGEVVLAMARGALEKSGADYAIAVSGIAGPGGGSAEKPVGTVWLAWGCEDNLQARRLLWPVERSLFQTMIAAAGLDMIRRTLLGIEEESRYMLSRRV